MAIFSKDREAFWLKTGFSIGNFTPFPIFLAFSLSFLSACHSDAVKTPDNTYHITLSGNASESGNIPPPDSKTLSFKMEDVSVLFPLPTAIPNPMAIRTYRVGAMGELVPRTLLNQLPLLEPNLSLQSQSDQLELVSIRFDPPSQEIRLIWQVFKNVVNPDGSQSVAAFDTAIHAFYRITDAPSFISDLSAVVVLNDDDSASETALSVHPSLAKEGMNGEFAQNLILLLLKYCGEKSIFKMTFMQASGEHLHWGFGGFTYTNGVIANLLIPKINISSVQTFTNSSASAGDFIGGIDITPSGQDEFDAVIMDSTNPKNTSSNQLEHAHFTAVTLENPILSPTTSVDCASCHVAQMEKLWIESHLSETASETSNVFTAPGFNLENLSKDVNRSDNLRSFGYFAGTPSISQRTINESALIAGQLNQMVAGKNAASPKLLSQ